jgi:polyisoprenoid-binding protein YceI
VEFDKAAKTGKVEVTLDMTSVNSGTAAFDKHLQSADIFNADQFPVPSSSPTSSCSTATSSRK